MSAFVARQEKGLSFAVETLDLAAGDQQRSDLARLSISARVPTLVDGDFALSEPSAIAEYLGADLGAGLFEREVAFSQADLQLALARAGLRRASSGMGLRTAVRRAAPLTAARWAAGKRHAMARLPRPFRKSGR